MVDEGGAATFSLREAARAVGVSPGAAYRHFEDKAALLAAVIDREFADLADELLEAREQAHTRAPRGTPALATATVFALATAYVRRAARYPHRFRLAYGSPRDAIGPGEERTRTITTEMRAELVATGAIGPEAYPRAAWSVWPAVHGLASLAADGWVSPEDVPLGVHAIVETVLLGLGVDQASLGHAV